MLKSLDPADWNDLSDYWRYWEERGFDIAYVEVEDGKKPRVVLRRALNQ